MVNGCINHFYGWYQITTIVVLRRCACSLSAETYGKRLLQKEQQALVI